MNLRDLAEGQSCVRCGADGSDGSVVLCHYTGVRRGSFGGGMGIKVRDIVGAHLCPRCHREMDTQSRDKEKRWEHSEEFLYLCALTWIRLFEQGSVVARRAA